jgi:hypothetical protein
MSHQVFESERRHRLRSVPADAADERVSSRSGVEAFDEDGGARRARRLREDPSGRRSLTGLEFRRQRSI